MQPDPTRPELVRLEALARQAHALGEAALELEDTIAQLIVDLAGLEEGQPAGAFWERLHTDCDRLTRLAVVR
jgi:hypothetical protein